MEVSFFRKAKVDGECMLFMFEVSNCQIFDYVLLADILYEIGQ
jgi:hypothetical protein